MVRKINILVRNWKYTSIGITLVLIFVFAAILVSQEIYKEATAKAELTASNVAMNSVGVVKNTFVSYHNKLKIAKILYGEPELDDARRRVILHNIKNNDTTLYASWSYQRKTFLYSDNSTIEKYRGKIISNSPQNNNDINVLGPCRTTDGRYVVVMYVSVGKGENEQFLGIDIDLQMLHSKIAENKDFKMAYITVVSNDMKYVYHPDQNKIGKYPLEGKDWAKIQSALEKKEPYQEKIYSDYLELELYRYYYLQDLGHGNKWVFTANVPNFGFVEFIDNMVLQIFIIAILALICFVVIFFTGMTKWKKELVSRKEVEQANLKLQLANEQQNKEVISQELEILKSGLNPHFLFNSLSSLRILVRKDTALAGEFATSLSNLYRYMLDYQNLDTVALEDEIEFTENYIFLQQIRFRDKLFVDFSINMDMLLKQIPPISVQTLVENAIKHNQITKDSPLYINIYVEHDNLIVENKITPLKSSEISTGLGQKNLIARYRLLCAKECGFYTEGMKYYAKIPLL